MHKSVMVLAALALVGCQKTGDNEYEVVRPGLVTDTITTPTVGTTTDTVNVPVFGTQKDTIIVDKPTAGTKKAEITRPTVKKP